MEERKKIRITSQRKNSIKTNGKKYRIIIQPFAPGDPAKESFFQRLDISYSISESSNTSNPVSISSSMRKRNSFLEDPIKTHKHFKIPNLLFSRYVP